ncbi:hypothetical protein [Kineosporia sp. A_224]|uniref:hypothetical protein n=1 Tax=Kineosporia sp. A_224 TaxID=1962180 RepID=UPI00117A2B0F|nr:hypothetical protein [Kineosporia sp. A_224]
MRSTPFDGPGPGRRGDLRAVQEARTRVFDAACAVMVVHRLDPALGCCGACGASSPCPASSEAARVLVDGGAWNAMPFLPAFGPAPVAPAQPRGLRRVLRGMRRRSPGA